MPDYSTLLDENQLLRHCSIRLSVHGHETAWVRDIHGPEPESALISLGLGNLTLTGPVPALRGRLVALLSVLEMAADQPDKWALFRMERTGERRWERRHPHPFVDRPVRVAGLRVTGDGTGRAVPEGEGDDDS
jgi:hypothetical protein